MISSVLRILFFSAISLMLLFGPLTLKFDFGSEAYAGGGGSGKAKNFKRSLGQIAETYKFTDSNEKERQAEPTPVPEPATMLLLGAGAIGLAAFKKTFKKK